MLDVQVVGPVDRLHQQIRSAEGVRRIELVLMAVVAHGHPGVARQRDDVDQPRRQVDRADHHRVRAAGGRLVLARVRADEQDVLHILVQPLVHAQVAVPNRHAVIGQRRTGRQQQRQQQRAQQGAHSLIDHRLPSPSSA